MKVAILSDIHGNLPAFKEALNFLRGKVDEYWCLGDIVGYGPFPRECLELSSVFSQTIVGNHDLGASEKIGLFEFSEDAASACAWTREILSRKEKDFLASLPLTVSPLRKILLVHGSPRDPIWEYIFSESMASENFALLREKEPEVKIVFHGHTHVPFVFEMEGGRIRGGLVPVGEEIRLREEACYLINPGSIGQPRDGDNRASFMIFDTDKMSFNLIRLSYPVEITQRKMEEVHLPISLIQRLSFGV